MRQLTEEERKTTLRNLENQKERLEVLDYYISYEELIINKGLKVNYEEQLKQHKSKLKELKEEKEDIAFAVKNGEESIAYGVEEKDGN